AQPAHKMNHRSWRIQADGASDAPMPVREICQDDGESFFHIRLTAQNGIARRQIDASLDAVGEVNCVRLRFGVGLAVFALLAESYDRAYDSPVEFRHDDFCGGVPGRQARRAFLPG